MSTQRIRAHAIVWLHIWIVSLLSASSPSGSTPMLAADAQATNIALLTELDAWMSPTGDDDPRAMLRERAESFETFRSMLDSSDRSAHIRSLPYGGSIASVADAYGLDSLLVASIVEVESSFNPLAVSHRGAVGLMQVLPTTASIDNESLHQPAINLDSGARYLKSLLVRYGGDLELALAAYNAGPGNVRRYGGVPPFRETRRYVDKVVSLYVDHHRAVWRNSDAATGWVTTADDQV